MMTAAEVQQANQERQRQQWEKAKLKEIPLKERITAFFFRIKLLEKFFDWLKEHMPGGKRLGLLENEMKELKQMSQDSYWMAGVDYQRIQNLNNRLDQACVLTEDLAKKAMKGEPISDKELAVIADKYRGIRDEITNEQKRYDALIEIVDEHMAGGKWKYANLPNGKKALVCPERLEDPNNEYVAMFMFDENGLIAFDGHNLDKAVQFKLNLKDNQYESFTLSDKQIEAIEDTKDMKLDEIEFGEEIDMSEFDENGKPLKSIKEQEGLIHDMYSDMLKKTEQELLNADLSLEDEFLGKNIKDISKELKMDEHEMTNQMIVSKMQSNAIGMDIAPKNGSYKSPMESVYVMNRYIKCGLEVKFDDNRQVSSINLLPDKNNPMLNNVEIYNHENGVLNQRIDDRYIKDVMRLAQALPKNNEQDIIEFGRESQKNKDIHGEPKMPKPPALENLLKQEFGKNNEIIGHNDNIFTLKNDRNEELAVMMLKGQLTAVRAENIKNQTEFMKEIQSNSVYSGKVRDAEALKEFGIDPAKLEQIDKTVRNEMEKAKNGPDKDMNEKGEER